jgi:hypothetical protein
MSELDDQHRAAYALREGLRQGDDEALRKRNHETLRKECVLVQDACNLSGVLQSWAKWQTLIRDDAARMGIRYETHPANILFLSKITSLMRVTGDAIGGVHSSPHEDLFHNAYKWAKGEL